jgi:hypothetical protein
MPAAYDPARPARRLSFANSSSRGFLATVPALVLTPVFATDRSLLGVLGWRTGSSVRDGGEPPEAKGPGHVPGC